MRHLIDRFENNSTDADLGLVELWAMKQKTESPLFNLASFGTNITNDGEYTWHLPYNIRTESERFGLEALQAMYPGLKVERVSTEKPPEWTIRIEGTMTIFTNDK